MIRVITVYSLMKEASVLAKDPSCPTFGVYFDFISIYKK